MGKCLVGIGHAVSVFAACECNTFFFVGRQQFVGETLEGLVEAAGPGQTGLRQAMTDRYFRVTFQPPAGADEDLTGEIVRLRIDADSPDGLEGALAGGQETLAQAPGERLE